MFKLGTGDDWDALEYPTEVIEAAANKYPNFGEMVEAIETIMDKHDDWPEVIKELNNET